MKQLLLLCFFSVTYLLSSAQTITGTIMDKKTRQPIPYVNIGIVGRGIGTVSDMNGRFSISLHDSVQQDQLKFSSIGYKPLTFIAGHFRSACNAHEAELFMEEHSVTLTEVVVRPKVFRTKVLGNTNHNRGISAGFMSNDLGSELGTIMKIKRSPTFIENVNFNIANNLLDSVKFRLNIYSMKNGQPDSVLLKEAIYITTKARSGTVSVDLKPYSLWVRSDFLVSLEWIEDYGKEKLYFCAGLMDSNSLYRKTSQDRWRKASPVGIGIYSTVTFEK